MDLNDFLAQLGITSGPLSGTIPQAPPQPQRPYVPFDTSQIPGGAFAPRSFPPAGAPQQGQPAPPIGMPLGGGGGDLSPQALPAKLQMALQQEAQGQQVAPAGGGFTPQPRAPLPAPLTQGPNSAMFTGYGDRYSQGQGPPPDPIAALLGSPPTGPGFAPQAPPSRAVTPPWAAGPQYAPGEHPLTESEKALLRQHPAYQRTISKFRSIDRLRAQKGMM